MRMRRPISSCRVCCRTSRCRRATVAKELIKTGYTAQAVTGIRGRSGRSFRAHLALQQTDEGKWRVELDELWAKEGANAPDAEAGDVTVEAEAAVASSARVSTAA